MEGSTTMHSTALRHTTGLTKLNSQLDYILLDGSGSMQPDWWNTLDAIEAYVQGLKSANVGSQIMLSVFDTNDLDYQARNVPLSEWRPLREDPIGAHWGGTPLYDAIALMGRKARDLDPPRAAFTIATDGGESDSQHTDVHQAKAILDWMRAKGWQVTFIGAGFDNSDLATRLGCPAGAMISVSRANLKLATLTLAGKRARYGLYGDAMHYTSEEQSKFGGYLGHG